MNGRPGSPMRAAVIATATVLTLGACAAAPTQDVPPTPMSTGSPVDGGTLRAVQISEPRSLDPAVMNAGAVSQGLLGNALYGTLLASSEDGTEIIHRMATDFSTDDGGATFRLTLRPDLRFTDGTVLDAAAIEFNWERLLSPELASASRRQASEVAEARVVDDITMDVVLRSPNPLFAHSVVNSALNWIASPTALTSNPESFGSEPVGAGPFTLQSWARQNKIELERNPDFWEEDGPHLDGIVLRTMGDSNQRVNAMTTGGADLAAESSWSALARARHSKLPTTTVPMGGGQLMAMNFRRAPFDDIRARRAVSMAIDLQSLNLANYNGHGKIPATLFDESSPFWTDTPLSTHDPEAAQALFDELAAEGKPVSFAYTAFPTLEDTASAASIQAQLSAFDNVEVSVEAVDFPTGLQKQATADFDMIISSAQIQDPDYGLWAPFYSGSSGNRPGIADPALDDALIRGRFGATVEDRKAAYLEVQERLIDLVPGIWYARSSPSAIVATNVGGVSLYGLGSPLPEKIWIAE